MRDGDIAALEVIYNEYGRAIKATAMTVLKDPHLADDTVSAVLIKLFEIAKRRVYINNPKTWIYRITYNLCLDKLKKRREVSAGPDIETEPGASDKSDFYSAIVVHAGI